MTINFRSKTCKARGHFEDDDVIKYQRVQDEEDLNSSPSPPPPPQLEAEDEAENEAENEVGREDDLSEQKQDGISQTLEDVEVSKSIHEFVENFGSDDNLE